MKKNCFSPSVIFIFYFLSLCYIDSPPLAKMAAGRGSYTEPPKARNNNGEDPRHQKLEI